LLGLLTEIWLSECSDWGQKEQFFIGNGEGRSLLGSGIGVTWWHTKKSIRPTNALAKAVCENVRTAVVLTRVDVKTAIAVALKDNALNKLLPLGPVQGATLFDVYTTVGAERVSAVLWETSRVVSQARRL
jgi:hypothetical protein